MLVSKTSSCIYINKSNCFFFFLTGVSFLYNSTFYGFLKLPFNNFFIFNNKKQYSHSIFFFFKLRFF